jgi:hypothetical protein
VFEAPNPHEMVLISTPNIYKVFDNLHMLWMWIWIRHHAGTAILVGPDLESQTKFWVMTTNEAEALVHWLRLLIYMKWFPPTSTKTTYKVFDILHMQ